MWSGSFSRTEVKPLTTSVLFLARKVPKFGAFNLFSGEEISIVVVYGFYRALTCMHEVGHNYFFL
jgi:hypothetical protein